ncbi:hypothetical protein [Actinomadura gamaensis]|uniref:Integral membrane protein n=1 Tax=Actinomadura gamaensis TaxID=1763541 RepID=A0ABV9TZB8_9ACTN
MNASGPSGNSDNTDNTGVPDAGAPDTGAAELERLRAEVADLRARLAERPAARAGPAAPRARGGNWVLGLRKAVAIVLISLAAFGAVASVIGVWGARTALNTDRWVATVAPLPNHPEVNAAMATYLTGQVFQELNVQQRLTEALPPKAAFLAGPTTDAVQTFVRERIQRFMATEEFRTLWENANRNAHTAIVAVLENRSATVAVQNGTVTLNLLPIVNNVLVTVERQLPTLFGKKLDLPELTSGQIPPGLQQRIQNALGITLPADFAQIKLYHHDQLGQVQRAVVLFKRSVVLLVVSTLLCLVLAVAVSPNRRRTLLQFGVGLAIAVVVLTVALRAVRDRLLEQVPDGLYRQAATVTVHEVFRTLRTRGDQLLWLGLVIAVVAYLAGPGRVPRWLRHMTVAGSRQAVRATREAWRNDAIREWLARNQDPVRIGAAAVAVLAALLVSSWLALLIIAVLLIGFEVLVTLVGRQVRSRAASGPATAPPPAPPPSATPPSGPSATPPSAPGTAAPV